MNIGISTAKRWCRLPALARTFRTALWTFRVTVVAAEAIPAPGTKLPPVTGDRVITAADVTVERVGTSIHKSLLVAVGLVLKGDGKDTWWEGCVWTVQPKRPGPGKSP